ncbi:IS4 family transposase [Telmatocola sphagniphila]|uniref:IS4 family transposase n=1 Tax=Telmatocola sphagniphila TaxID=1123043 RepID=A0A8E6B987_9BACT|nr:IS4 family transposase [Telmatocola sphagniphila]QVL32720.1 IS4 family transposase [Telmatocola sphagniphila]
MPHQGQGRSLNNATALRHCIETLTREADFRQVRFRSDCSWTIRALVAAALYWAWSETGTLAGRWGHARGLTASGFGISSLGTACQPFLRLLTRWSDRLLSAVAASFRQLMAKELSRRFRVEGFIAFAVDGTRHETPRTAANERAFALNGAKKRDRSRGKKSQAALSKASSPQVNLTLLWHLGTGLPWAWKRAGSGVGERALLRELLQELPPKALLVADAGFTGYDLWGSILSAGHDLLVRVGSHVRLLSELGLQQGSSKDRVWLWPDNAMGLPLELRLIKTGSGTSTVWLVTTVLDRQRLPDDAVKKLYRQRWGIEVFYRTLKQKFERRKLRSRTPQHVYLELDWSLMALWALGLLALLNDRKVEPRKVSFSGLLGAVRTAMRDGSAIPKSGQRIEALLKKARIDDYKRGIKRSRNYPRKNKEPHGTGDPHISPATPDQRQRARKWFELFPLRA